MLWLFAVCTCTNKTQLVNTNCQVGPVETQDGVMQEGGVRELTNTRREKIGETGNLAAKTERERAQDNN